MDQARPLVRPLVLLIFLLVSACSSSETDSSATTVDGGRSTSADETSVPSSVLVEGVLYERATGLLLCDPQSTSACSRGVDLGWVPSLESLLDDESWSGRRSSDVVTLAFRSDGTVDPSDLEVRSTFVESANELRGYFDQGPPTIGPLDIFEGPVCGGRFHDEPADATSSCDRFLVALGMSPMAWRVVDRDGASLEIRAEELSCAGTDDAPHRRYEVIPSAANGQVELAVLVAPLNEPGLRCGPNELVTLDAHLDSVYAALPLAVLGRGFLVGFEEPPLPPVLSKVDPYLIGGGQTLLFAVQVGVVRLEQPGCLVMTTPSGDVGLLMPFGTELPGDGTVRLGDRRLVLGEQWVVGGGFTPVLSSTLPFGATVGDFCEPSITQIWTVDGVLDEPIGG